MGSEKTRFRIPQSEIRNLKFPFGLFKRIGKAVGCAGGIAGKDSSRGWTAIYRIFWDLQSQVLRCLRSCCLENNLSVDTRVQLFFYLWPFSCPPKKKAQKEGRRSDAAGAAFPRIAPVVEAEASALRALGDSRGEGAGRNRAEKPLPPRTEGAGGETCLLSRRRQAPSFPGSLIPKPGILRRLLRP